jgi:hypothetical protein
MGVILLRMITAYLVPECFAGDGCRNVLLHGLWPADAAAEGPQKKDV